MLRRLPFHRLSLALLLAALLLAQSLGQLHRLAHGPERGGRFHAGPELATLFQGHQQDGDCRLYDQLATGDAAVSLPALALPLPPPALLVHFVGRLAPTCHATLYEARGPPTSL